MKPALFVRSGDKVGFLDINWPSLSVFQNLNLNRTRVLGYYRDTFFVPEKRILVFLKVQQFDITRTKFSKEKISHVFFLALSKLTYLIIWYGTTGYYGA